MNKRHYIKQHDKLIDRAINLANVEYTAKGIPEDKRDYSNYIADEELGANAQEIAGYYLKNYPDNALEQWKENTRDIQLDKEEQKVAGILGKF